MNERVLELAIEARKYAETKPDIYQVAYDKKFAELIVAECLTQVDKVDAMLDDPKEKLGVSWVGLAIAKHFGLE